MQIRDIMTRNVEVIGPDATLQEAARKMRDLNVGPIPVCDGKKVQGMLTDRDIVIRATAEGKDPRSTRASEVMTPEVVYCFEDQDVEEAARLMQKEQIRRLLVLDQEKNLVGILSLGDLAIETQNDRRTSDTLERISEPSESERRAA